MTELPNPRSITKVADWIELNIALGLERLSKPQVSSAIEGLTGEEPSEPFISDVWRVLEARQTRYSTVLFMVGDQTIERGPDVQRSSEYLVCLILSLYGVQGTTRDPAKFFERITSRAVKAYLSGMAMVFGWPALENDQNEDGESQISRKIKNLAATLKERFVEPPPARFNDRGVDVIGWIPFSDLRSSQLVLLIQCYAGQDWKGKLQVPLKSWCQYIHWGFNPVEGFAVPGIIPDQDWHETSKDKGILFDRIRIMNLTSAGPDDAELTNELDDWIAAQLDEIEA